MKSTGIPPALHSKTLPSDYVLYVVDAFPSVTQTFVEREIVQLAREGSSVCVYPIHVGPRSWPWALEPGAAEIERIVVLKAVSRPMLVARFGWAAWRVFGVPAESSLSATPTELIRLGSAISHTRRLLGLVRRCVGNPPVHVHAHFVGRCADVARLAAAAFGVGYSVTAHASDVYAPREQALFEARVAHAGEIVCASDDVERALIARRPQARTSVVRCGIDVNQLIPRPESSVRPGLIVTVGRLVPTKGYRTVVETAERLVRAGVNFRWELIGDGPLRGELAHAIAQKNLSGSLILRGALPNRETLDEVSQAQVLVLPCERNASGDSDGIPVALMEAMALGVPVVTTHVGGISELIQDRENGFVVPSSDAGELTQAIERAMTLQRQERERVVSNARRTIERSYNLNVEVHKLRQRFATLIALRGPAAALQGEQS